MQHPKPELPTAKDYKLLRITPDSTLDDLRKSFRILIFQCHPDVVPNDPDAGKRFNELVQAKDRISDAIKNKIRVNLRTEDVPPPSQPEFKNPKDIVEILIKEAKSNPASFRRCLDAIINLEKTTGEDFDMAKFEIISDFVYGLAESAKTVVNTRIFILQILKIRELERQHPYGFDVVAGGAVRERLQKLRNLAKKIPRKKADILPEMLSILSSVYPEIFDEVLAFVETKI